MSKVTLNGNTPLLEANHRSSMIRQSILLNCAMKSKTEHTPGSACGQFGKGTDQGYYRELHQSQKRIITNFTAGMARGLGLTLGTFVVLGLLGLILSQFVNMPIVGQYIADLLGYIDDYKN